MSSRELLMNNAATTLTSALSSSATTLSVASASLFPASGDFRLLVELEMMLCTAISGTTLTVVRGVEGTTAASHASGVAVVNVLTQGALQALLGDNVPLAGQRPPLRLVDASGNPLTTASFGVVSVGPPPVVKQRGTAITVARNGMASQAFGTWMIRPLPSQRPAVLTACVDGMGLYGGYLEVGVGLYCSSTGKAVAFIYQPMNVMGAFLYITQFSAPTTTSGGSSGVVYGYGTSGTANLGPTPHLWMRICYTGDGYSYSISDTGINWMALLSQRVSDFFSTAPDSLIFVDLANSPYPSAANLLAWDEGANVAESGLVSWYPCNENPVQATLFDHGPAELHQRIYATISGGQVATPTTTLDSPSALPGRQTLDFNGTSNYTQTTDWELLPLGSTPRTLSLWFKCASAGAIPSEYALLGWGYNASGQFFQLSLATAGLELDVNGGNATATVTPGTNFSGSTWPDTGWHHLAVVVPTSCTSNAQIVFYLDGALLTTTGHSDTHVVNTQPGNVFFGRSPAASNYFPGKVCDVRVYNTALTSTGIGNLYNGLNADGSAVAL
jgi:hypothetical protein